MGVLPQHMHKEQILSLDISKTHSLEQYDSFSSIHIIMFW